MKFIRLDEDHFAYLTGGDLTRDQIRLITEFFENWWPRKKIMIMRADQFIARPGEYEVVRADVSAEGDSAGTPGFRPIEMRKRPDLPPGIDKLGLFSSRKAAQRKVRGG